MVKPKMWNVSKTDDRRAKRTKNATQGTTIHTWRLLLMPDSVSLVWGHSVHFAKPILEFTILQRSIFQPIHPNFIQGILIMREYSLLLFWRSAKKLKKVWHFEIFLNTGPYAAGNFKVLFPPQFSLQPTQTL